MAQPTNTTILLVAGDVSGDINSARLAELLRRKHPGWTLHVVGGEHMGAVSAQSPGGQWIGDTSDLSGVGIYTSIRMYPRARRIWIDLKKFVRANKIDAAVLCDWGAFNCPAAEFLKKQGVPVLYYFPPGSWRRSGKGGLGIASIVDRVATPFEWSAQRLTAAGCKAEWVAHPMLEIRHDPAQRGALRQEFGIGPDEKLVALLPGSRMSEITCLGPRLAETAAILRDKNPKLRFIVAASHRRVASLLSRFPDWVKIVSDRTADILFASDAAVVKSGTATLEAAVIGVPQVIVYDFPWVGRIEWLVLWMWKRNIPFIGMPNVLLERLAVKELLGPKCKPEAIAAEVTELLEDNAKRNHMVNDYADIRDRLGASLPLSGTERTAEILEELVAETRVL